jgi:peptide/nickel transport system permease protein
VRGAARLLSRATTLRAFVVRLVGVALAILGSTVVIFVIVRLIPGDPISVMLERFQNPVAVAALKRLYGLDQPIPVQYLSWLRELLTGNLGYSLLTQRPVLETLKERIPPTLYLMAGGIAVSLILAIAGAIVETVYPRSFAKRAIGTLASLSMSMPVFWLGYLLIIVFAAEMNLLPATGYVPPSTDLGGFFRGMILPWLTLGISMVGFFERVLAANLRETLDRDYVRSARARGLSEMNIVLHHCLRNASIVGVTVLGLNIGYLMGGTVIVERVFAYPGMGQLILNSIVSRDYPLIQACLLFFVLGFIVTNVFTDVLYGFLDPRVRNG